MFLFQLPAMVCDIDGCDLFARLKTGSGKTLCYLVSLFFRTHKRKVNNSVYSLRQLPAAFAIENGKRALTVIFSPLLSLMEHHYNLIKNYGFCVAR